MKKIVGVMLTGLMIVSCISPALAANATDENSGKVEAQSYEVVKVAYKNAVTGVESEFTTFDANVGTGRIGSNELSLEDYTVCATTLVPIDDTTYNIVTPTGEVIATYSTEAPDVSTYGTWRYSWTAEDGQLVGSDDPVSSYEGFQMSFTMNFSSSGSSKIGLIAVDDNVFYPVFDKSNSFSGTITCNKDLGDVAFAVENNSGHGITYSGTLSY